MMDRKKIVFILSLFLMLCLPFHLLAAKVLAPEKGGKGFQAVTLEQAKELHGQGANFIACHSHTTDFMKGHPPGTKHITCLVPKDHKRTGMPLSQINFDIGQLPDDKSVPIVTYCASNTWWKSYHAARLAVKNGYSNVNWMRDGIKGWKNAGYPTEGDSEVLEALMEVNKNDFAEFRVTEDEARKLENCAFVDFRSKEKFDKDHIKGARHVDYENMFSKPMMEELNKSNSLIILHDDPVVQGVIAATLKMMDYPDVYILK